MRATRGFTLVEVLVSLVLLGIATLGTAAAGAWAARVLEDARVRDGASARAALLLDSLVELPAPVGGRSNVPPYPARWSVTGDTLRTIELRVTYPSGDTTAELVFGAAAAPAPPRLEVGP